MHHILASGTLLNLGCSENGPSTPQWNHPISVQEGDLAEGEIGVDHFQFYLRDASVAPTEGIVSDSPRIGPTFGAEATAQDQFFLISTVVEAADIRVQLLASTRHRISRATNSSVALDSA